MLSCEAVSATSPQEELVRIRRERDLYARLLRLGDETDPALFLGEALRLVVDITGAAQGYLELMDEERRWSTAHGFSAHEVDGIRLAVSRGIIAEALASGETILTGSATIDPRFRARESVVSGRIDAVLCAPIGKEHPLGIVYLQGRTHGGMFTQDDRVTTETFAHHLVPFADRLLQQQRRRDENDATREVREKLRTEDVIGRSRALATVLYQVSLVAALDIDVLLLGETGTGKSQLAHVIHVNSPRRGGPFVELNCAALPEALIESELFGALPGAHSTATQRTEGKIAAAEHGTLLLDEVGDLPPPAQAKLLQLIQSKQYFPLGAKKPVSANARIIAATNVDLEAAVAGKRFREDLFYRLNVIPVRVPSLAERRDDIPLLAEHFAHTAAARHRLPALSLSPGGLRALEVAEWPGNVRQLEHTVQAGIIRAAGAGARQIDRAHLFPEAPVATGAERPETFQDATRRFQATLVRSALEENGWNVIETARRLDIARSHLYTLIRAFGLERTSS
jgi:transcriptional regulator with GAF, ATPase, and Fis domain